jgi:hypothetical protein
LRLAGRIRGSADLLIVVIKTAMTRKEEVFGTRKVRADSAPVFAQNDDTSTLSDGNPVRCGGAI